LPDSLDGPDVPRLMLIPGGRAGTARRVVSSSRMVTPAALRAKAHALAPMESFPDNAVISGASALVGRRSLRVLPPADRRPGAQVVRVFVQYRRIIACCLLALAIVAGLWIVLRAIGGVAGGGTLTSSGGAAAASGASNGPASPGSHPVQGQAWTVRPGDTLWGLVEAAGVAGDPRPVVDQLSAELRGQPLQVGEVVTIP